MRRTGQGIPRWTAAGLAVLVLVPASCLRAQGGTAGALTSRLELRIETLVNRQDRAVAPCEVVHTGIGVRFASWSAIGRGEPSGNRGITLSDAGVRCGSGAFPSASMQAQTGVPAPLFLLEVAADAGWDAGAMDPGPQDAVQVSVSLTSSRLAGFSAEGKPSYSDQATSFHTIRLEHGEDHIVPVPAGTPGPDWQGFQDVMIRVRAGWAGRPRATEYGALSILSAAPGSDVFLDGGAAGKAGADGSLLFPRVPVGLREVRLRGTSGRLVTRFVSVAKGKTVALMPEPVGTGTSSPPTLTPAGKNAEGFPEYRRMPDGAVMIRVPEGEFLMGNLETEGSPLPHKVNLTSPYLIDKLPVTVGRYKLFAASTGRPLPPDPYWGVHDDFPVAFVRWDESRAYCEWAGGRLPTEAEREKATRGTDGRLWPWGNEPPPTPDRGVFRRSWGELGNDQVGIRPLGASPYGLLDAGGNMWEWCEDWFDAEYFKTSPPNDPPGPRTGRARVVKGGSWDSRPTVLSASSRNFGYIGYREGDYGFRCAADAPK